LVANEDEYDEDVELEKLRRRRFVFLPVDVVCTSSSVSSSVVLLALSRIFKRRFRGARLPLLVVAVVVDDDDVSDLRFFSAKNRSGVSFRLMQLLSRDLHFDVWPPRLFLPFPDDASFPDDVLLPFFAVVLLFPFSCPSVNAESKFLPADSAIDDTYSINYADCH
jgi:hypothetical protein